MTRPTQPDPMDHLADALVEDILATPGAVLFAESAEDHGDPRALAAEFDRILTSSAWPVRARPVGPGVSAPRALARNASQRTATRTATSGRRVSLERLRRSLPSGGRLPSRGLPIAAVSLLALVALSAVAALHWQNRAGPDEELMHGASPAATRSAPQSSEYLVLLPEQASLDAALASYRQLQGRFVALLGGRDPVIRKRSDHAYVAGIGPFTKADEAKNLCVELKRAGAGCDVVEAGR